LFGNRVMSEEDPFPDPIEAQAAWLQSSSPFPVAPFAWYRIAFEASAPRGGMWAAVFFDARGRQLDADHYCGFGGSDEWAEQVFCFRAKATAAAARFRFHPMSAAVRVREVAVEEVSREAVAAWADALWATMPPLDYTPPPGRWRNLPKLSGALKAKGPQGPQGPQGRKTDPAPSGPCGPCGPCSPFRVVMLGDSIVNDTGNSPWDVLVERLHPGLRLEVVTSVRGGTGCWHYREEGRVKPCVLDFRPDLLMIGGISHNEDIEAIRSVVRQVRAAADPDILLMTGAFGKGRDPREDLAWMPTVRPGGPGYRSRLMALAAEEGCGFLDLEGAWGAYLLAIDQPYAWLMRDDVHANARGHQLLARILERYFVSISDTMKQASKPVESGLK